MATERRLSRSATSTQTTANSSPPMPGDGVAGADGRSQAFGDLDQEFVAGGVAGAVVDLLEAVEVDVEDTDRPLRAGGRGQGVVDPVVEQGPVGQAGERVVEALVQQRVLGLLAGGDVLDQADPVRGRPVAPVTRPTWPAGPIRCCRRAAGSAFRLARDLVVAAAKLVDHRPGWLSASSGWEMASRSRAHSSLSRPAGQRCTWPG